MTTVRFPRIPGLLVSDGELMQRARRLNRLMLAMNDPDERARFVREPDAVMGRFGLLPAERALLAARDWQGLLDYGVSIYALAKGAKAFDQTLLDIGAQMRGCTTQELLAQLPMHHLPDLPGHAGEVARG